MTDPVRRPKHRARAARQALRVREAKLLRAARCHESPPPTDAGMIYGQHRPRVITTRAALRGAVLPPGIAAVLRNRLRLIQGQETE